MRFLLSVLCLLFVVARSELLGTAKKFGKSTGVVLLNSDDVSTSVKAYLGIPESMEMFSIRLGTGMCASGDNSVWMNGTSDFEVDLSATPMTGMNHTKFTAETNFAFSLSEFEGQIMSVLLTETDENMTVLDCGDIEWYQNAVKIGGAKLPTTDDLMNYETSGLFEVYMDSNSSEFYGYFAVDSMRNLTSVELLIGEGITCEEAYMIVNSSNATMTLSRKTVNDLFVGEVALEGVDETSTFAAIVYTDAENILLCHELTVDDSAEPSVGPTEPTTSTPTDSVTAGPNDISGASVASVGVAFATLVAGLLL